MTADPQGEWDAKMWSDFATACIGAAFTEVARKRKWDSNILCAARDAIDIAIDLLAKENPRDN